MKKLKWIPLVILFAVSAQAEERKQGTFAPKFYAFQNGVSFGSEAKNADTLKELGYDGVTNLRWSSARSRPRPKPSG